MAHLLQLRIAIEQWLLTKKTMKGIFIMKTYKGLVLSALVGLMAFAAIPQKAQAYSIISIVNEGYVADLTVSRPLNFLLCTLFLPVCILSNEQTVQSRPVSETLAAHGLDSETAAKIVNAIEILKAKKMAISPAGDASVNQLTQSLTSNGVPADSATALANFVDSSK